MTVKLCCGLKETLVPILGWPEVIVNIGFVTCTLTFILTYVKRMITLGFLIVIAPLITITYSIDKMGDGKSQALNTWLKEFIFNVLIQPFHCIIYIVFISTIFEIVEKGGLGEEIIAVMCVFFLLKAESIVKKIFGIRADSMADTLALGAATVGVLGTVMKAGAKKTKGDGDRKMPVMTRNQRGTSGTGGTGDSGGSGGSGGSGDTGDSGGSGDTGGSGGSGDSGDSGGSGDSGDSARNKKLKAKEKIAKALYKGAGKQIADHYARKGGINHIIGNALGMAAGISAGAMTMTTGSVDKGVVAGFSAYGAVRGVEGMLNESANEKQLERNQEVFGQDYEEFAEAYRRNHAGAQEEEVWSELQRIYNTGGIGLSESELRMWSQMDQLKDSAEIVGYSDGFDLVKDTMRLAAAGKYKDK